MSDDLRLAIVQPSYTTAIYSRDALINTQYTKRFKDVVIWGGGGSLLTLSHNLCWCYGLNGRSDGVTHLLMMHTDIAPKQKDWIDILYDEMAAAEADVLSVIVPIKSPFGLTSTAFDIDPWSPRRLTMTEALALPKTWTAHNPDLLINTGLMLVDFRKPWVEPPFRFHVRDRIIRTPEGAWKPDVESEDWNASRQMHKLGLRVFATRAVTLDHYGQMAYPNDEKWGAPIDPQTKSSSEILIETADGEMQRLEKIVVQTE